MCGTGTRQFECGTSISRLRIPSIGSNYLLALQSVSFAPHQGLCFLLHAQTMIFALCAVVDNHRVLHGRSAFDGKRRMCGAYIGVDEYKSKLAVLKEKFDPQLKGDTDASTDAGGRSVWSPYL